MKPSAALLLVVPVLAAFLTTARCADDPMYHVLFFSRSQGFEHSVIKEKDGQPGHVQTVLTQLGPANHVEFTFSKDGGIFTSENLARYDAFFFYTTGDLTHREDSWLKPEVQSVILSGLHWVVGDTEADLTPNLAQTCPEANTLPVQPPPTPQPSAAAPEPPTNTLSEAEKAAGWTLLFNGTDFAGWHNFKQEGVRPGWRVQDGAMVCADPHTAGDLVTTQAYASFELELDYNIAEAGNSGIMYHVTDDGPHMWSTGPECQLLDNEKGADPQRCGWLYGLYQPPIDPTTGKSLDATKPAGQWNHVRLLISRAKCEHDINDQKYLEYVLGSDDFKARVAKSKFGKMPGFATATTGWIGLQGDHGSVSFRNIKVRPLPDDQ